MSKLTKAQKEQLKICVIDSTVKRLSTVETQQYIKERMGVDIGVDYIWHLRGDIKRDRKQTFDELRKDRYLFLNSIFFDRVEELRYMQKVLHQVIETNQDDGDIQIKAVVQLQSITNQLEQYYIALPSVAKAEVADINTLFLSPSNNNNNINDNNSITTKTIIPHNPTSNNCKCQNCTDPEAKF